MSVDDTITEQQTRTQSRTRLLEQINICLQAGDYSRALDFLRGRAAVFANDEELSKLETLAHDGVKRNAEANRLITESQELFALQKSDAAIQLLRQAYELDKKNSLARAILANALVEHAHSIVETDWLEAETLANQALGLNPAHPTAKTIRSLVIEKKKASCVDDWVAQARKRQSSGNLFAALAWVAEGLAVHPDDPKLLQIQDAIQRDQGARRRQARRGDLEDLRRVGHQIDGAADAAAKQALAERIQSVAAKHWTDGEILSVANGLLRRLGLVQEEGSTSPPRGRGATVIFHVPRSSAPETPRANPSRVPPTPVVPKQALPIQFQPVDAAIKPTPSGDVLPSTVPPGRVPPGIPPVKDPGGSSEPEFVAPQAASGPAAEPQSAAAAVTSASSQPKQPASSHSITLILVSAAAIILFAAIFFFARKHHASPVAKPPAAAPSVPSPSVAMTESAPAASAPAVSAAAQAIPEAVPSDSAAEQITRHDQPARDRNLGTLLVVTGRDDAKVFLNGKLQPQLTQSGQLRLPNLELKDYVVRVSKSGYQDSPQQKITVRKDEEARLVFNLQPNLQPRPGPPSPRMASLTIQGGDPGATVLLDQNPIGTVQPDGTFAVSTVNPGDHTVELRKDRFKPRQFNKQFLAGGTISLSAADAALEAAPGELRITFTPADAKVSLVKGQSLSIVSSGVPLNLAAGIYTLTARTADKFTRWSTLEVVAGQSRILDLSLAPNGMAKWDDPGAWKQEKDVFTRKGGDFVLYGVVPPSGTFALSAMATRGHFLQWVVNYSDPRNYILFQMDDNNFYRTVIRNGVKTDQVTVPDKGDKKSPRTLHIRVSPTEIVHQIRHGDSWTVLDRWAQPGSNLSLGRFGFYIPGNDQVTLSSFAHYADLSAR